MQKHTSRHVSEGNVVASEYENEYLQFLESYNRLRKRSARDNAEIHAQQEITVYI